MTHTPPSLLGRAPWVWVYVFLGAPAALRRALRAIVAALVWSLRAAPESRLVRIESMLEAGLASPGHSTARCLRKLRRSRHGAFYSAHLPRMLGPVLANLAGGRRADGDWSAPAWAAVTITGRCNLKCEGCFARSVLGPTTMPPAELRRRIEELLALGTRIVIILGGEPLLYPDLLPLLASYPDALFFVYTNATLMDERAAKAVAGAPNVIPMLSVEGSRALTDARRGRGVFDRVVEAHRLLTRWKAMHGLSVTVTAANVEDISRADFLATFDERSIAAVHYLRLMDNGCSDTHARGASAAQLEAHNARVDALREVKTFSIANIPADEQGIWGRCPAGGRGLLHIMPDQRLRACIFSQRDVLDASRLSLASALAHPRVRAVRDAVLPSGCGQCSLVATAAGCGGSR